MIRWAAIPTRANCDPVCQPDSIHPCLPNTTRGQASRGKGHTSTRAAGAGKRCSIRCHPIRDVSGINDDFGVEVIVGTCTTCHDTPHAGNHSVSTPLDIGIAAPPVSIAKGGDGVHNKFGLPVGDMPIYALKQIGSDDLKFVTDPGRALASGKWKDIGRFKGPILRGLAGRAPYFHNGSAASLIDVVSFYDMRFSLGLTDQKGRSLTLS
jgi:hypothetical protein